MTGKLGDNNVAVMQLQTDEAFGRPGENFLVARYSRDIGSRSKVGGLVVNKEAIARRALQPDVRGRHAVCADAELLGPFVPRPDRRRRA